jgi:hypothetical protein
MVVSCDIIVVSGAAVPGAGVALGVAAGGVVLGVTLGLLIDPALVSDVGGAPLELASLFPPQAASRTRAITAKGVYLMIQSLRHR